MDFALTIAFLVLYYVRPQEWVPGVGLLRPVTVVMGLSLLATMSRKGGFGIREVLKTPHDWLLLVYFGWIVASSRSPLFVAGDIYNVFVFYIVTVLALSDPERIRKYIGWWAALILWIAAMAVLSEYGVDPMGGHEITHGGSQGRLVLNTSNFCNANALGHSVVPVLLMLYFLLIWNRPVFAKVATIPLLLLPAYCIYLTSSKGAFLSGFATAVVALCLGRPKLIQMWILIGVFALGVPALRLLPRMSTMDNATSDEGIRRRINAFHFGYSAMRHEFTGVGYGKFEEKVKLVTSHGAGPHSSYVLAGAEFGLPGLFLFCGVLYVCYRTLWLAKTTTEEEERIRRILFVLLFSYCVSSWMVEWALRGYFFLIVAAIAGFQRYLTRKEDVQQTRESLNHSSNTPSIASPDRSPRNRVHEISARQTSARAKSCTVRQEDRPFRTQFTPPWNRLRLVDFGMIGGLTVLTMSFWKYVMMNL